MTKLDEIIKSMQENLSKGSIIQFHNNQGKLSDMLAIVEKVNKYSAHVFGITPGYGFTVTAGFDTFDIVGMVKRMPSKQPTEDIYEVLERSEYTSI
ncbi:MAG: hypothetical protein Q8910_00225 [Bacteroidota bacterium]|nr:hypothetical protein [Bacteroidota bacterium]